VLTLAHPWPATPVFWSYSMLGRELSSEPEEEPPVPPGRGGGGGGGGGGSRLSGASCYVTCAFFSSFLCFQNICEDIRAK